MPITPDTKNWTWVLDRRCPECGVDVALLEPVAVPVLLRAVSRQWTEALNTPGAETRSDPAKWSTLEYGCHVRDVCRIYDQRLSRMLEDVNPMYPNWDQDNTAILDRYAEQNPLTVATELASAAEVLAQRFESVSTADWTRTGQRSDGATFNIESFARYFIHDPIHHLHDVGVRVPVEPSA